MPACVISCIFGRKFRTAYPSVKNYDAYFFSNNPEIRETVEKSGWKYIFVDFPLSDDDAVSSFQSMYVKFLRFLKDEAFDYFRNYDKIVYTDHKLELKDEHIEYLLSRMDGVKIIIREHPGNRKNIWEEAGDAMYQDRYLRFMPQTIDYIREKLKEGYTERCVVVLTSLIVYSHLEKGTIEFVDSVYNDLKETGTSQCRIIWSMAGQKHTEIIRTIGWGEINIRWEEPEGETETGSVSWLRKELQNITGLVQQYAKRERYLKGELKDKSINLDILLERERCLEGELKNKIGHIEQLVLSKRKLNAEISDIHNSEIWKIASKLFTFVLWMFPYNSKRRLFTKRTLTFIRHPFRCISEMTFIKNNT